MKTKLIIILALFSLAGYSQQNSKLADRLLLSVQSGPNALSGPNIVTNGSMELDANWTTHGTVSVNERSTTHVRNGIYSRKFIVSQQYSGIKSADFTTVTSGVYNLVFSVYPTGTTNVSYAVRNGADTDYLINTNITGLTQNAWNTVTTQYVETGGGSAGHIIIQSYTGQTSETWYVDDVIIKPINATALLLPTGETMTNTSAIPTYGHKGNSSYLAFDGVDDKITMPSNTIGNLGSGDFTFVIRVNRKAAGVQGDYWQKKQDASNYVHIYWSVGNTINIVTNAGTWSVEGNSAITTTGIHTIIFESNRASNTGVFYVNGSAIAATTYGTIPANLDNTGSAVIGFDGGSTYNNDDILSFRLFNYSFVEADRTYYSNPSSHLKAVDSDGEGDQNLLNLDAESMVSPTLLRDWYHSVDIALTGATAPRLVRSWEGMSAWRFNGTTSYLSSSALLSGEWTFSAWVCPTVGPERYQYLLYTVNGDIYWDNVGFEVAISSNNATTISTTGDGAPKEVWTHIVITRDAVGYTKIYCSGILNAQGSSGTPGTASVFNIGKILTSNYFQGVIEGFQINKGIWSSEQIQLDYLISQ